MSMSSTMATSTYSPPLDPTTQAPVKDLNWFGLTLTIIPLITILGNGLVIISVLKFRALHSAINFLILGLAVADLFVALFVMPYAVYVHVYNNAWYLGDITCDIYMACDVTCSTASIMLLAVISFDRYRAVSRPIQYSRQSQNIQRVVIILIVVWVLSLAIASPMVFGVNIRPDEEAGKPECRFFNAQFSIGSSMISFVIPCFIVLFVYARIIVALKKREKAARQRRLANAASSSPREPCPGSNNSRRGGTSSEGDEAGRIVAGPVVNVMMLALPSMTRRMKQYERHRKALEAAGEEGDLDEDLLDDDVSPIGDACPCHGAPAPCALCSGAPKDSNSTPPPPGAAPTPARLRRFLMAARRKRWSLAKEHEFGGSSTPRSSIDESLSDNVHVVTNDFVSEGYTTQSRRSSDGGEYSATMPSSSMSSDKSSAPQRKGNKKFMNIRHHSSRRRRKSFTFPAEHRDASPSTHPQQQQRNILPAILRQLSRRSPKLFRSATVAKSPVIIENEAVSRRERERDELTPDHERPLTALTETETISASLPRYPHRGEHRSTTASWIHALPPHGDDDDERSELDGSTTLGNANFSRSTTVNSAELFDSGVGASHEVRHSSLVLENPHATDAIYADGDVFEEEDEDDDVKENAPTVTFSMRVQRLSDAAASSIELKCEGPSRDEKRRKQSSVEESAVAVKIMTESQLPGDDEVVTRVPSRHESSSTEGGHTLKKQLSKNGGLAVRLVKKTMKHEQSLKRKVSKSQRKEKRATKTLGIVVGIFLICWVPFFTMQILNAVCTLYNTEWCQVGFSGFFYSTWLGYMNSFMNPIIYTIFNTEFRRAFKSLLFGRHNGPGAHRGMLGVRV